MRDVHPYEALIFAGSPLDRMDARRRDAAWIGDLRHDPASRFVPVWRTRNLLRDFQAVYVRAAEIPDALPWAFLGTHDGRGYFAVDASAIDVPAFAGGFEELFRVGHRLTPLDAAILAHARGLMHWQARHGNCGVCGAVCTPHDAGHVMHCGGCGVHHFPRTDPAVIMLVTDGDRALLGQPSRFRELRVFTTLAGFVEPGESLEEAVAREVFEEAGVRVTDVRYRASQPWPFPASVMLGFSAEATTTEITIDPHELLDARWFTREELRAPQDFVLPPLISIARRLIDDWMAS